MSFIFSNFCVFQNWEEARSVRTLTRLTLTGKWVLTICFTSSGMTPSTWLANGSSAFGIYLSLSGNAFRSYPVVEQWMTQRMQCSHRSKSHSSDSILLQHMIPGCSPRSDWPLLQPSLKTSQPSQHHSVSESSMSFISCEFATVSVYWIGCSWRISMSITSAVSLILRHSSVELFGLTTTSLLLFIIISAINELLLPATYVADLFTASRVSCTVTLS